MKKLMLSMTAAVAVAVDRDSFYFLQMSATFALFPKFLP